MFDDSWHSTVGIIHRCEFIKLFSFLYFAYCLFLFFYLLTSLSTSVGYILSNIIGNIYIFFSSYFGLNASVHRHTLFRKHITLLICAPVWPIKWKWMEKSIQYRIVIPFILIINVTAHLYNLRCFDTYILNRF